MIILRWNYSYWYKIDLYCTNLFCFWWAKTLTIISAKKRFTQGSTCTWYVHSQNMSVEAIYRKSKLIHAAVCYDSSHITAHDWTVYLTLTLLVANFANANWCKKLEKWLKPWQMGTHLKELRESYPMNTNMTGFRFSKKKKNCALDEISLSIEKAKNQPDRQWPTERNHYHWFLRLIYSLTMLPSCLQT